MIRRLIVFASVAALLAGISACSDSGSGAVKSPEIKDGKNMELKSQGATKDAPTKKGQTGMNPIAQ